MRAALLMICINQFDWLEIHDLGSIFVNYKVWRILNWEPLSLKGQGTYIYGQCFTLDSSFLSFITTFSLSALGSK